MIKRLTKLLILAGITVVGATTVSFGYYYFGGISTGAKEAIQDLRVDNIFENYATINSKLGAKRFTDETYTMYIFPSAEYMIMFQENKLPEEFGGYLEPQLNDDGSIKFDEFGKPTLIPRNHTVELWHNPNFDGDPANTIDTYPADNYVKYIEQTYTIRTTGDCYKKGPEHGVFSKAFICDPDTAPYRSIKADSIVTKFKNTDSETYYNKVTEYGIGHFSDWTDFEEMKDKSKYYHGIDYNGKMRYYQRNAGFTKNLYDIYNYFTKMSSRINQNSALTDSQTGKPYNRPYGDPSDIDFIQVANQNPTNLHIVDNNGKLFTEEDINGYKNLFTFLKETKEGYYHQGLSSNAFSCDRFGCWSNLSIYEGRYLPIKLQIRNSISPQEFNKVVQDLQCSMNDGNGQPYFNNNFNTFVYAKPDDPAYNADYVQHLADPNKVHARDYISSFETDNVFDITASLDEAASPGLNLGDDPIIRLFPTFSSGKGYRSTQLKGKPDVQKVLGGKDALNLIIYQYNKPYDESVVTKDHDPNDQNLVSVTDKSPVTYGHSYTLGKNNIYCAPMNNIPINIRSNGQQLYTRIVLRIHLTIGPASWNNPTWMTCYDINYSDLAGSRCVNELNGSGYYNFYWFIANLTADSSSNGSECIDNLIDTPKKLGELYTNFPELRAKKLRYITKNNSSIGKPQRDPKDYQNLYIDYPGAVSEKNQNINDYVNKSRPTSLYAQKATEPKLYLNLDGAAAPESIQNKVNHDHDHAVTGFNFSRPVFDSNLAGANRIFSEKVTDPFSKNVYDLNDKSLFMFKAVDFTTVYESYLQLRWGNQGNPRISINVFGNYLYDKIYINQLSNDYAPDQKDTQGNVISGAESSNFIEFKRGFKDPNNPNDPVEEFFKMVYKGDKLDKKPGDPPGVDKYAQSNFAQLKNDDCKGIYDIVLMFNLPETTARKEQFDALFDMYIYRHTNIFVKLFDRKLTEYVTATDPQTQQTGRFIKHTYQHNLDGTPVTPGGNVPVQLWEKRYYIGATINGGDTNEFTQITRNETNNTFGRVLETKINQNIGFTYDNLVVKDQITGMAAAWYVKDSSMPSGYRLFINKSLKIHKNYCLYLEKSMMFNG